MRGLVVIVVCCVPLALAQASANSAAPSGRGKIVYSSMWGPNVNNAEIFSIGIYGSQRRDLTRNQGNDGPSAWSPTGDRVSFWSSRDGISGLYVMRADGSEQRLLTPPDIRVAEESPTWSPDGRRLAFSSSGQDTGIWVVGADGEGLRLLAEDARSPVWAPQGRSVAFVRMANYQFVLEIVDADGGAPVRVADRSLSRPTWSPDGSALAYVGGIGNDGDYVLYRVAAGGGTPERIYWDGNFSLAAPAWSPTGTTIAFSQYDVTTGRHVIKTVDANGGVGKALAVGGRLPGAPAWSPDGSRIAFATDSAVHVVTADGMIRWKVREDRPATIVSGLAWSPDGQTLLFASLNRSADDELFVVNPDGSQWRQLTRNNVDDELPAWSPDHTRIAFMRQTRLSDPSIWVMTSSGRHQHRLRLGTHPSWSPNGWQLVFERDGVLYTMTDRGRSVRRITTGTQPVWAPRGRKVAFLRGTKVFLANVETRAVRRLADRVNGLACAQYGEGDPARATVSSPEWSTDARRLVVSLACDYYKSFYVAGMILSSRGDGVIGEVPIHDLAAPSRFAWSPDGKRLALSVAPPNNSDPYDETIATAKPDGTDLRAVTSGAGLDHDPDW